MLSGVRTVKNAMAAGAPPPDPDGELTAPHDFPNWIKVGGEWMGKRQEGKRKKRMGGEMRRMEKEEREESKNRKGRVRDEETGWDGKRGGKCKEG